MKDMDLMTAMTDLDEDLLNHESTVRLGRQRIARIGFLAAVLTFWCVSVCGSMIGIDVWFGQDLDGYYSIDYQYPMEPVVVPAEACDDMANRLVTGLLDFCDGIQLGDYQEANTDLLDYSSALDQQILFNLEDNPMDLEKLEDYLGVDFKISTELREIINAGILYPFNGFNPGYVKVYGPRYEDAMEEYSSTGTITPQGIGLNLYLRDEEESNWYAGLRVYIPLTSQFAEQFQPDTWYAQEGMGQYHTREYSNGQMDFVIAKVDYTEEYGDTCLVFYTDGGIGYELYCCTTYDGDKGEICKNSEDIILPLIENLK